MEKWKQDGVRYIKNGRTHQDMPLFYSQYEDAVKNKALLDILATCKKSTTPTLVIHGTNDDAVPIEEGRLIAEALNVALVSIADANHTFGATHPWNEDTLPAHLKEVCEKTLQFITAQV